MKQLKDFFCPQDKCLFDKSIACPDIDNCEWCQVWISLDARKKLKERDRYLKCIGMVALLGFILLVSISGFLYLKSQGL
jgi:hypothetical protein